MSQQFLKEIEYLIDGLEVALNSLRASLKKTDWRQTFTLQQARIESAVLDAREAIQRAQEACGQT